MISGLFKTALGPLTGGLFGEFCAACGRKALRKKYPAISDELASAWELSPRWVQYFNDREGIRCRACRCSLRSQYMASVLVETYSSRLGISVTSFRSLCRIPTFRDLKIAEINACGGLHSFLKNFPKVSHSEYGSTDPRIPHEDLTRLSYADNSFDLVLHSETLEHVPDCMKALSELARITRPTGLHIFTVPLVWERSQTRVRARLQGEQVEHLLSPSYHGPYGTTSSDRLVFSEFGRDFLDWVKASGFPHVTCHRNEKNPALSTIVASKN
ncbi:MAG TPA: class I SAM-dependent methyltransferase [Planctomicrobium sp.]|nr:class I SAM-dependent methyltransferase [Planctomicrobium sp.]